MIAPLTGTLAGVDLFLVCHRADVQRRAIEAVVRAVESGRVPRARIDEAHRRLDRLMARFVRDAQTPCEKLLSPEHLAMARGLEGHAAGRDPTEVLV